MTRPIQRREFLTQACTASAIAGLGNLPGIVPLSQAFGAEPTRPAFDSETDRLARLLHTTPRDKIVPVMIGEVRKGISHRQFLAALFLEAQRHHRQHPGLVHHSVTQLSLDVGTQARLLPLLWHADAMKWQTNGVPPKPLEQLPPPGKAADLFEGAMRSSDEEMAQKAIVVLARSEGPRTAYERLWQLGAGPRCVASAGHIAINVSNFRRSLDSLNWELAETVLQ